MSLRDQFLKTEPDVNPNTKSSFISDSTIDLLNFRILEEERSSRVYHAMHIWCENYSFENSALYFDKAAQDELIHAEWARQHLLSFNILPKTQPIPEVQCEFNNLYELFYLALDHETLVTTQCQELAKAVLEEKDLLTFNLSQKYLSEQIEELNLAYTVTNLIKNYGEGNLNVILFDKAIKKYIK